MGFLRLFLLLIALAGIYSSAKRVERSASGLNDCPKNYGFDIVMAIDASYSMRYGISSGAQFVNQIGQELTGNDKIRLGLFLYNDEESKTSWKIHLTDKVSSEEMDEKLTSLGWEYQYGEHHGLAIATAINELVSDKRPKTVNIIVLLTDGQSESDDSALKDLVEKALCQGIKIFAVIVETENLNEDNFSVITGNSKNVFNLSTPEQLAKAICALPEPVDFNENYLAKECDFKKNDFMSKNKISLKACEEKCRGHAACTHYAYSSFNGKTCFLKNGTVCPSKAYIKRDEYKERACGIIPERLSFM